MECLLCSVWALLGYASLCLRVISELVDGGCTRSAVVWKMVPHCILWCIWRERNNRCFEEEGALIT
jgi:hypothetical protein